MNPKPNRLNRAAALVAVLLVLLVPQVPAAQNTDAINDLLRGGGREQQDPATPYSPPDQRVSPAPPLPEAQTWSDPQIGTQPDGLTRITYHGQAAGDGRKARSTLIFKGGLVTGTIWNQSVCETNVRLGGADLDFEARLSGAWESEEASIDGTWEGTEHFCGADQSNHGSLTFFLKDDGYFDPVLHLRLTGERGRYGWNFAPAGRVVVEDPGAVPGPDGTLFPSDHAEPEDPDGADNTPRQPRRPPWDEIDPDTVTGFDLLPSTLYMAPGGTARLPDVLALIGDADSPSDRMAPDSALDWQLPPELEIVDGALSLSENAMDETKLAFGVQVTLGDLETDLKGVVRVRAKVPLGRISGRVVFDYHPAIIPNPRLRPVSAEVELHPGVRIGNMIARTTTGPDGAFRFDNLRGDYYQVVLRSLVPPGFPPGYVLEAGRALWHSQVYHLGVGDVPEWQIDRAYVAADVARPEPTDGSIYGRVIYKDKGVSGVKVMARNVADSDIHDETTSRSGGRYQLKIDELANGTYWITAERYRKPGLVGPDDLLDIRTNRLGDAILVNSPLSDPRGVELDIEVDALRAIFGGPAEQPHIPILPDERGCGGW